MSEGLRAILDGRRGDVTQAEFDEWRVLTLRLREKALGVVRYAKRSDYPKVARTLIDELLEAVEAAS